MRQARLRSSDFWTDYQPGLRSARFPVGTEAFFDEVTRARYYLEPHIPELVAFSQWKGRAVLEAGCGIATDGARFVTNGAMYTGLDASPTALGLARRRFTLKDLSGHFVGGSVTNLPFADRSFDLVFSHGVIHHIVHTAAAAREFYRVLKPGGTVLVMVYHRNSFNYYFSIMTLRRILLGLLVVPGSVELLSRLTREPQETFYGHRALLREHGPRYLFDSELFLSHNTDGPGNPLSKVYSRHEFRDLFAVGFQALKTEVRYLNLRLYPAGARFSASRVGRSLERRIGWHLYLSGTRPVNT